MNTREFSAESTDRLLHDLDIATKEIPQAGRFASSLYETQQTHARDCRTLSILLEGQGTIEKTEGLLRNILTQEITKAEAYEQKHPQQEMETPKTIEGFRLPPIPEISLISEILGWGGVGS